MTLQASTGALFADVQMQANDGESALTLASSEGHQDVVQMLLAAGAEKDMQTNHGSTSLTIASEKGHLGIVQDLLNKTALKLTVRVFVE